MSHSKPVSAEELNTVREILGRMQAQGVQGISPDGNVLESLVGTEMSAGPMPSFAAMTDASKRRGEDVSGQSGGRVKTTHEAESSEEGETSFTLVPRSPGPSTESSKQLPIPVKHSEEIKLPPGIPDLTTWGQTVCELPKVKSEGMTYAELVKSTNSEHKEYLEWVIKCGQSKGPRCNDLRNYLLYGKCIRKTDEGPAMPGTSKTRKMRTSS